MNLTRITRKELYKQVWKKPMLQLAKEYGMSDRGLTKLCNRYDIPTPPRGYWRKLETGQKPEKATLPKPVWNPILEIPEAPQGPSLAKKEVPEMPALELPPDLRRAHPLIRKSKQLLEDAGRDGYSRIIRPKGCIDVYARLVCQRRALIIMDGLLKYFENLGYTVGISEDYNRTYIEIDDQRVDIAIEEHLVTRQLTPSELRNKQKSYSTMYETTERGPVELLTLSVNKERYFPKAMRRNWKEKPGKPLEDMLPQVIRCIHSHAEAQRKKHEQEKEEERQRQEEKRKQQEIEDKSKARWQAKVDRYESEKSRVECLHSDAESWDRSQRLREYIEVRTATMEPGPERDEWVEWAVRQADRMDPLVDSPKSVLDNPPPSTWTNPLKKSPYGPGSFWG